MKIFKISRNIGVEDRDIKKIFGIGLLGAIVAFFSGCIKNSALNGKTSNKTENPPLSESSNSINKSTDVIDSQYNKINDSCGPTPGYPCGTRYYTVSIKDFRNTDKHR